MELTSLKLFQILKARWLLENRDHELFKYDILFRLKMKHTLKNTKKEKKLIFGDFTLPARNTIKSFLNSIIF